MKKYAPGRHGHECSGDGDSSKFLPVTPILRAEHLVGGVDSSQRASLLASPGVEPLPPSRAQYWGVAPKGGTLHPMRGDQAAGRVL